LISSSGTQLDQLSQQFSQLQTSTVGTSSQGAAALGYAPSFTTKDSTSYDRLQRELKDLKTQSSTSKGGARAHALISGTPENTERLDKGEFKLQRLN
jgi:hypothetical protein